MEKKPNIPGRLVLIFALAMLVSAIFVILITYKIGDIVTYTACAVVPYAAATIYFTRRYDQLQKDIEILQAGGGYVTTQWPHPHQQYPPYDSQGTLHSDWTHYPPLPGQLAVPQADRLEKIEKYKKSLSSIWYTLVGSQIAFILLTIGIWLPVVIQTDEQHTPGLLAGDYLVCVAIGLASPYLIWLER